MDGWGFLSQTDRGKADRYSLDATTTGETADGGLGDTLDVVSKDLAMAFGTALPEALATFASYCRKSDPEYHLSAQTVRENG
jgi:hypothetical protein